MTFGERLIKQIQENWDAFLREIYEEKAKEDLAVLARDPDYFTQYFPESEEDSRSEENSEPES